LDLFQHAGGSAGMPKAHLRCLGEEVFRDRSRFGLGSVSNLRSWSWIAHRFGWSGVARSEGVEPPTF
jgi:hypothetical protein